MLIGERIRSLRESKDLSQGDIEERTGMPRAYISRVENGHTVPSLETLENLAGALGVPLYRFFYEGDDLTEIPSESPTQGVRSEEIRFLNKVRRMRERKSGASDDARLAFRTLARVFSNL
jgi:transcriptional regulator with XRE-family HTH domain